MHNTINILELVLLKFYNITTSLILFLFLFSFSLFHSFLLLHTLLLKRQEIYISSNYFKYYYIKFMFMQYLYILYVLQKKIGVSLNMGLDSRAFWTMLRVAIVYSYLLGLSFSHGGVNMMSIQMIYFPLFNMNYH
jgi:hypothetical protein